LPRLRLFSEQILFRLRTLVRSLSERQASSLHSPRRKTRESMVGTLAYKLIRQKAFIL
jgi:hypothetical protein